MKESPHSPNKWFRKRFPRIARQYGDALCEQYPAKDKPGKPHVTTLSEDFFAAVLGEAGFPDAPAVYVEAEKRFYRYDDSQGIYAPVTEHQVAGLISILIAKCAEEFRTQFDTRTMRFRLRSSASLRGVVERARARLQVPPDFFQRDTKDFLPCANGILRLKDRKLLPFSPSYKFRHKLAIPYVKGAKCPRFLAVLEPQLTSDDIDLLQRVFGLALAGINLPQKLILLIGTAGGGKGTAVRVLVALIGSRNVASLRTEHLSSRFELASFHGKTLLYGADVASDFLDTPGAAKLKSLVGGDNQSLEFKGGNDRVDVTARYNAIVVANSELRVSLDRDRDAWKRRLVIIRWEGEAPKIPIADLSEQIIAEEGTGVLSWGLDGLERLRADGWNLRLTNAQRQRVDHLLDASESDRLFVREGLVREERATLTVEACYSAYLQFCGERRWQPLSRRAFGGKITALVLATHGAAERHDLWDGEKHRHGWKGIALKTPLPETSEGFSIVQLKEVVGEKERAGASGRPENASESSDSFPSDAA